MLNHLNLTITHRRGDRSVIVPIIKKLGIENVILSESWMCDVIEKLLTIKAGGFVDVGVNVGQTLIKLKLVNGVVPYIGFDPNPSCIFYAKALIDENGYDNAILVPVGISDENQLLTLDFYSEVSTDSSASIIKDLRNEVIVHQEFVACLNLQAVASALQGDISMIKIDVEGAELEVLRGIIKLLENQRPFVLIEILPVYSMENVTRWNRQQEIERMVTFIGYRIFRIGKRNDAFDGFIALQEIGLNKDVDHSDYLLCPLEFCDRIICSGEK